MQFASKSYNIMWRHHSSLDNGMKRLKQHTFVVQTVDLCANHRPSGFESCPVCVQHFEGYDPEGFSMWLCDYKYNDENTINYVVMNKVHQ